MSLNKKLLAELLSIFSLPLLVFIIHLPLILRMHTPLYFYDIYQVIQWIDHPMHFLGGLLIGRSYFLLIGLLQRYGYTGHIPKFTYFVFVVSLVAMTAVAWEIMEFSLDSLDNGQRQPSLADTMQDLIFGILGGAAGLAIQFFIMEIKNK